MAISKDNVKSNFMELSGLDSTSAEVYAGLITVCADEMEKAVDQERMVAEGGTAICEFAAAAEVFYRFICLKAAEYKVMFTAQGKAVEAFDEENRIKAARELRDSAVSRAERFFSKDGFVFNAVIALSKEENMLCVENIQKCKHWKSLDRNGGRDKKDT